MPKAPSPNEFEFFHLKPDNLDYEWMRQPELYFTYACKLAEARNEFDQAKAERDLVAADLDNLIRTDPKGYGLKKTTEAAIKACILTQNKYKKANDKVNHCKHLMDTLAAAVDALDHRKRALEKLVDLHLANYFSRCRPSETARSHIDEVQRKSTYEQIDCG